MQVRRALKLMRKHGLTIDDDEYVLPLLDPSGDGKVSSRMLTYAHVCSRMLTYAHVCSRMLTYAHVG
jgi:hypothetical protein